MLVPTHIYPPAYSCIMHNLTIGCTPDIILARTTKLYFVFLISAVPGCCSCYCCYHYWVFLILPGQSRHRLQQKRHFFSFYIVSKFKQSLYIKLSLAISTCLDRSFTCCNGLTIVQDMTRAVAQHIGEGSGVGCSNLCM